MSVVAGASLFDGVLLLADTRASVPRRGLPPARIDNLQKLVFLTPSTVVGFVGDVATAGAILAQLVKQAKSFTDRRRMHPLLIEQWLPRLCRHVWNRRERDPEQARVAFMVASVVPDRANVVSRVRCVELMDRFRLQTLSADRNWLPDILVKCLMSPPEAEQIVLMSRPRGLLYTLRSPRFLPQQVAPLHAVAIGSGQGVATELKYREDMIFAGQVGNSFMETEALQRSVEAYLRDNAVPSVGGLLPAVKVTGAGLEVKGLRAEVPVGGTKVELGVDGRGRWVQRNLSTGKTMALRAPWEVSYSVRERSRRFDDLEGAERAMRRSAGKAEGD